MASTNFFCQVSSSAHLGSVAKADLPLESYQVAPLYMPMSIE